MSETVSRAGAGFGSVLAFVRRDMRAKRTYKLGMTLGILNTLLAALTYAFLGQNAQLPGLAKGVSFVTFLIVGVAFNEFMIESLKAVQKSVSPSELEEILSLPVRLRVFVVGNVLWGYLWHGINALAYLSVGILFFGVTFGAVDYAGAGITLVFGIALMLSFSLLASGVLLVTKQGDIVQWVIGALGALFSGVYFPIALLPTPLQSVSWFLPQTYFLALIRESLSGHQLVKVEIGAGSTGNALMFGLFLAGILLSVLAAYAVLYAGRRETERNPAVAFLMLGLVPATTLLSVPILSGFVTISVHRLLVNLLVYAMIMLPLGYLAFRRGLRATKSRGTLYHV
jgi:ABC-2 type transport system permease protein